jgi:hypothetical protein
MVFKLEISRDNSSFFEVDLFPDPQLEYNVDFYDSLDPNKIRLPFSSSMKIPMTTLNMGTSRFAYNPLVDTKDLFPKDPFFFKIRIFGSSNVDIEGLLNVQSFEYLSDEPYIDVNLDDFVSKYISDLKDATIAEVYDADTTSYGTYFRGDHTFQDFLNTVANNGEEGVLNQNPTDRPIIFPYIDFCNDVDGKFGYGARQFTEYGTGMDRAGIVPVFSVKNFLTTLGYWITAQGFNTRVDSKLFALNYTEAIPEFEAEKLQMLIPSKLEADVATNTREFRLRQAPFWAGTNESLTGNKTLEQVDKDFISNYFWNSETFGNYGASTTDPETGEIIAVTTKTDYGLDATNAAYPNDNPFGYERGYFAPFMSFNAELSYQSGAEFATVNNIDLEIPVIGEDGLTYQIEVADPGSTMTFGIFIGVWENGEMIKKLRLEDSTQTAIELSISDAIPQRGSSQKVWDGAGADYHFFQDNSYRRAVVFADNIQNVEDELRWVLEDDLYLPSDTDIEISGESRYGVNYFIEPLQGEVVARVALSYQTQGTGNSRREQAISTTINTYGVEDIRKAITRTEDYSQLDIKSLANANFNPYFTDDIYNIKDSLENTATLTPYQVLVAICKRFNCGIYYEKVGSQNILRIDPLHLMRSGNQDINDLVDDLKSVKVYLGGDKVKDLTLNNNDYGLYFDDEYDRDITIGSTTQEINPDGVSDLVVDFKSSIYYKSVCGEALFQPENDNLINGIVSSREVAFTPNLFTKHQDIGLRFAYVDKPLFRTEIKKPFVVNSEARPNILTLTQRIYIPFATHVFNGRLFHYNTQGWNLLAEDEDGNTTDYYTFYTDNEKIKYSNSPVIEFNMVLQTSELASLDFFFKTLGSTRINQSEILIKSAEGEVFEDYAYLTIKGLLQ